MAVGVSAGAILGTAVLLILHAPFLPGGEVRYAPFSQMSDGDVLVRALIWMPLATAIPEELAFRGVLLASLRQHLRTSRAVVISALVFAAWHGIIVLHTVGTTSLSDRPWWWVAGCIGGFTAVFLGGIAFAWIRVQTESVYACITTHWLFNAGILCGLYLLR
jgi:membrane protease YdiL (CAAX protease family)